VSAAFDATRPDAKFNPEKYADPNNPGQMTGEGDSAGLAGKVVEVEGVITEPTFPTFPRGAKAERFYLRQSGRLQGSVVCYLLNRADWRQVQPGMTARVVGVFERTKTPTTTHFGLRNAVIVTADGPTSPAVTAEEVLTEFRADRKAFEAKWKREDRYVFLRGPMTGVGIVQQPDVHTFKTSLSTKSPARPSALDVTFNTPDLHVTNTLVRGDQITVLATYRGPDGLTGLDGVVRNPKFQGLFIGRE